MRATKRQAGLSLLLLCATLAFHAVVTGAASTSLRPSGFTHVSPGPGLEIVEFGNLVAQSDGGALVNYSRHRDFFAVRRYRADGSLDRDYEASKPLPRLRVVQADGSAIQVEGYPAKTLVRVRPDGSLDPGFGTDGRSDGVRFPISTLSVTPSGEVLAGGYHHYLGMHGGPSRTEGFIARFETDGTLDEDFGVSGVVNIRETTRIEGAPVGIAALKEGRSVLALRDQEQSSSLIRLDGRGMLDPDFGANGVSNSDAELFALHRLTDGRLLTVGTREAKYGCCRRANELHLARYQPDGKPDGGFADGGAAVIDFGGKISPGATLWGAGGSLTIGGSVIESSVACRTVGYCREAPALMRIGSDGGPDRAFGDAGVATLEAIGARVGGGVVKSLVRRPGGGFFAVGGSDVVAFLAAVSTDGKLDEGFDSDGFVTERRQKASSTKVRAIAVDLFGRLLLAGSSNVGGFGPPHGIVFRVHRDGSPDPGFGDREGYASYPGEPRAISVDRRGRTLVLARSLLGRLTTEGEVDRSFGQDGFLRIGGGSDRVPILTSVVALSNGASLAAGGWRRGAAVVRVRPDGAIDRTFGIGGIARVGFGRSRSCRALDLVVQRDRRIVLAGKCQGRTRRTRRGGAFSPETMMVARLLPGGIPDGSFGGRGRSILRVGPQSKATSVAMQGRRVLLAGTRQGGGRRANLLVRLRADGSLDRRFALAGIARIPVRLREKSTLPRESLQALPTRRRIFLIRAGKGWPVLAFGRNGRRGRRFASRGAVAPGRVFETHLPPPGPIGAFQGRDLLLAWTTSKSNEWGGRSLQVGLQSFRTR